MATQSNERTAKQKAVLKAHGFKPGQSGNPSGRPATKPVRDMIIKVGKEATETGDKTKLEAVILATYRQAMTGKEWAVKFITEQIDGKAPLKMEMEYREEGTVAQFLKSHPEVTTSVLAGIESMQ
jgi:chitodextrinase